MRLSEILKPTAVRVLTDPHSKHSLIRELVALAAAGGDISDQDAVFKAVLDREALKTTGVGHGLATPHARCASVRKLVMAMAIARQPVDFDSFDGQPVSAVFLLLAPPDQTGPYIQALARVSRLMCLDALRARISTAADGAEIHRLLLEEESRVLK